MLHIQNLSKVATVILVLIAGGFCLTISSGCSRSTPPVSGVITALQTMQELATVEYTLTKVVKASDDKTWYKLGDRKILITCEATVKAGIDFSQLDTRYFSGKDNSISIQLPPPMILMVNLPPDKIRVAYQEIGFFRDHFSAAEQNELMIQAEIQLVRKAKQLGILEEAKQNTRIILNDYLTRLGFEQIDLQFDTPLKPSTIKP